MKKVKIGHDSIQDKDIFKLQYSPEEQPNKQFFNSEDVLIGNPSSNISIGIIYTWPEDKPPQEVRDFMVRISNYTYITGLWKTTNGTRYVFSNMLNNPNVNKLVLLVFDQKDNGHLLVDALTNFWEKGVNDDGIIIDSKAPNPRFEQVPFDAMDRVREQADLVVMRRINHETQLKEVEELITSMFQEPENAKEVPEGVEFYSTVLDENKLYDDGARFDEPYQLDLGSSAKKVEFIQKYSDLPLGQSVNADNLSDAIEMVTAYVYENGQMFKDQRGIITMESRSFSVTIKDPLAIIPESFSKEYIKKYVDEFMEGKGEGLDDFAYTYHERIFKKWGNQVEKAIANLRSNENTRRCMISLWDPETDLDNSSPPCLNFMWFVVREGKLEMHTVYRSHHLATVTQDGSLMEGEGAFVPNLYALGTLQEYIAKKVGIERGPLVLTDFSGHLYMSEV